MGGWRVEASSAYTTGAEMQGRGVGADSLHGPSLKAARHDARQASRWGKAQPAARGRRDEVTRCPAVERECYTSRQVWRITYEPKRNNPCRGCRALTKPCAYLVTETMLVSFTLLALGRRLLKCSGSCDMKRLGPENETAPRRGLSCARALRHAVRGFPRRHLAICTVWG